MPYMGEQPIFGQFPVERFSGDGSTTAFTLTYGAASSSALFVTISGVKQQVAAYSITDTTIDFGAGNAPPSGTNNIEVIYLGVQTFAEGIADNTVSTAKIADDAVTVPKIADSVFTANRNIIINGAMQIAQRGTSATGIIDSGYQTCDRWHEYNAGSAGTFTFIQETLTSGNAYADGFQKAYRVDCTTAVASPGAAVQHFVRQRFEGYNLQQFKKGTANALPYVVSFWVKSNQTGTGICALKDDDNSRYIGGTYTISVADTWEKKTVTFVADTTGVMNNDNGVSMDVRWWIGAGTNFTSGTLPTAWETITNANQAVGNAITTGTSTANDWAITGVQLEIGTTATPFENKTYGQELAACQRYYQKLYSGQEGPLGAYVDSTKIYSYFYPLIVEMRAAPTLDQGSSSPSFEYRYSGWQTNGTFSSLSAKTMAIRFRLSQPSAVDTYGVATMIEIKGTWSVDAEL